MRKGYSIRIEQKVIEELKKERVDIPFLFNKFCKDNCLGIKALRSKKEELQKELSELDEEIKVNNLIASELKNKLKEEHIRVIREMDSWKAYWILKNQYHFKYNYNVFTALKEMVING